MSNSVEVGHDHPTSTQNPKIIMKYTNIRYSTMLNDAQYDYLSDECQEINRIMCFKTFLRLAVMQQTNVSKKNFSAVLQPGQFIASKVELSMIWRCNRKTATRIVQEFNQLGFLQSVPSNRTTIHTLKCLSVWFTDQGTVKNKFFVINPLVKPMEKTTRTGSHVPPGNDEKTEENHVAVPSVSGATSPVGGETGDEGTHPTGTSSEGKQEQQTALPFPSCPEDAPKGQIANPPSGDMSKDSRP